MHPIHKGNGNDNASNEINYEIEDVPVDVRSVRYHVDLARNRTIYAIKHLAHDQPEQCGSNVAIHDCLQSQQSSDRAAGSDGVDRQTEQAPTPAFGFAQKFDWQYVTF